MLARDESRSIGEIVDEISDLFLPDAKEAVEKAKAIEAAGKAMGIEAADIAVEAALSKRAVTWAAGVDVAFDAQSTIRTLRTIVEAKKPIWGHKKENVAALESVSDRIKELQSALRTMPSRAWLLLFAKELITEDDLRAPGIQQEATSRTRAISGLLAGMLVRCTALIAAPPGKHKGADWVQQLCSDWAWDFLLRHDKQPTGANSADSLFRRVARLFYEGAAGKDADLEHACRKTFERRKKKPKRKKR
jgi:hypothetical protein